MLAQMAATAGSVAVGSTIGHGLSSMLFGGRSEPAPAAEAPQAAPVQQQSYQASGISCEAQAKGRPLGIVNIVPRLTHFAEFTKCLEKADLPSCTWYLEQLKAVSILQTFRRKLDIDVLNMDPQCQAAAAPY